MVTSVAKAAKAGTSTGKDSIEIKQLFETDYFGVGLVRVTVCFQHVRAPKTHFQILYFTLTNGENGNFTNTRERTENIKLLKTSSGIRADQRELACDLIGRLLEQKPADRLPGGHALKHALFWDEHRTLDFLLNVNSLSHSENSESGLFGAAKFAELFWDTAEWRAREFDWASHLPVKDWGKTKARFLDPDDMTRARDVELRIQPPSRKWVTIRFAKPNQLVMQPQNACVWEYNNGIRQLLRFIRNHKQHATETCLWQADLEWECPKCPGRASCPQASLARLITTAFPTLVSTFFKGLVETVMPLLEDEVSKKAKQRAAGGNIPSSPKAGNKKTAKQWEDTLREFMWPAQADGYDAGLRRRLHRQKQEQLELHGPAPAIVIDAASTDGGNHPSMLTTFVRLLLTLRVNVC